MSFLKSTLVVAFGFAVQVASHGHVLTVEAEGKTVQGFNPYLYKWMTTPSCGWRDHEIVHQPYVSTSEYGSSDINCHVGATPGDLYVDIIAGHDLTAQWTEWPESHKGPVITSISSCAPCGGDCTKCKPEDLQWNVIDAVGQVQVGTTNSDAGVWGADELRNNGNKKTVTIPSSIKAGNYVCRQEIIALMGASNLGKAQNYPNCFNIKVSGTGTDPLPSGTKGTDLYKETDPGIKVLIYGTTLHYQIPGPPLYSGAINGSKSPDVDNSSDKPSATTTANPMPLSTSHPSASASHTILNPSLAPNATGTMPSYASQSTGTSPRGYQSNVYTSTGSGQSHPIDNLPNPKARTSNPTGYDDTKTDDKTSSEDDKKETTTPKMNDYTAKTSDSDLKVPDGASASQLLDMIDRCVQALTKAITNAKRRRHSRDVNA